MALTIIESADVSECESALDANWNERKHLIEQQFALRLEIQEHLVKGDPGFQEVRERERLSKTALQENEEEYDRIVSRWGAALSAPQGATLA